MPIDLKLVKWVLAGYATLFLILGAFSIWASMGGPRVGAEEVTQWSKSIEDEKLRIAMFDRPFEAAQQRYTKLGEISLNAFQIIIGVIIGFLSAIGSIALGNKPGGDVTSLPQPGGSPPINPNGGGSAPPRESGSRRSDSNPGPLGPAPNALAATEVTADRTRVAEAVAPTGTVADGRQAGVAVSAG